MSTATVVAMASIGVIGATAEKILISFGKSEIATFVNIATLSSVGLTAITIVVKLMQLLASV